MVQQDSSDTDGDERKIAVEPGKPIVVDLKLDGKPIAMELDTACMVLMCP